eukprot:GDKJ01021414.1.p1 GENE.GDKJ01021414.1~~GDKJ01021414.1.p1  ORF type:complete len:922 (+),score=201.82 GDKJ01021414.1:416-2767(+)
MNMVQTMLLNTECWMRHMALDPVTGLDPPEIRLRAAQGFEAADFVVAGYWVWAKVIENLAHIGYDSSNMHFASYDWRLAPSLLQKRDLYFTRLVTQIEAMVNEYGKVVIIGHSMAAVYINYFINWVESAKGGNRGRKWIDEHVESIVNIGGAYLGVPKAMSAWLSGEMRDTAQLGALESVFMKTQFAASTRRALFRTWTCLGSLFPVGGERIWGDATWAPEEAVSKTPKGVKSFGEIVTFQESWRDKLRQRLKEKFESPSQELLNQETSTNRSSTCTTTSGVSGSGSQEERAHQNQQTTTFADCPTPAPAVKQKPDETRRDSGLYLSEADFSGELGVFEGNWTATKVANVILEDLGEKRASLAQSLYHWNYVSGQALMENPEKYDDPKYFSNVFAHPLPNAPHLKIYSLYGVGLQTERAYVYSDALRGEGGVPDLWGETRQDGEGVITDKGETPPYPAEKETELSGDKLASKKRQKTRQQENGVDEIEWSSARDEEKKEKEVRSTKRNDAYSEEFAKVPLLFIDKNVSDKEIGYETGVTTVEGDATVPLISLALPPRALWKGKTFWNPANVTSIVKEYPYESSTPVYEVRGGRKAADHVNIMGNFELIGDIINIVTGHHEKVEERIVSGIDRIVKRVNLIRTVEELVARGGDDSPDLSVHYSNNSIVVVNPEYHNKTKEATGRTDKEVLLSKEKINDIKQSQQQHVKSSSTGSRKKEDAQELPKAPLDSQGGLVGDLVRSAEEVVSGHLPVGVANEILDHRKTTTRRKSHNQTQEGENVKDEL